MSNARKYIDVLVFISVWMAAGWVFRLSTNAYCYSAWRIVIFSGDPSLFTFVGVRVSFCSRASGTLVLPAAAHAREHAMTTGNYRNLKTPDVCPACGENVPPNALACPECGADHNSGWREDADTYDGIDLPEETFNHEEFVKREFRPFRNLGAIKPGWWVTAILLLVAFAVLYFFAAH